MGKSSLENDGFMNDGAMLSLLSYLKREEIFEGTASELCDTLGLKIESNVLSRKLGKYENELQKAGVEFTREKKNQTRFLTLVYSHSEHGDDGDDIFSPHRKHAEKRIDMRLFNIGVLSSRSIPSPNQRNINSSLSKTYCLL